MRNDEYCVVWRVAVLLKHWEPGRMQPCLFRSDSVSLLRLPLPTLAATVHLLDMMRESVCGLSGRPKADCVG